MTPLTRLKLSVCVITVVVLRKLPYHGRDELYPSLRAYDGLDRN
jgi:hypothetical protein